MKNILSFEQFINESRLNESSSLDPFVQYSNNYANELVDLGVAQKDAKSFIADLTKTVETYFKCKARDLVIDWNATFDDDYDTLKSVAEIQGKKYGIDEETLDYLGIESDKSGNLWLTAYDVQRGDMSLVRKK